MMAKVIVWDESRIRAIQKMKRTLSETVVFGVQTNIPLLQEILSHEDFLTGKITTRFFETNFSKGLSRPEFSATEQKIIQSVAAQLADAGGAGATEGNPWSHTWRGGL